MLFAIIWAVFVGTAFLIAIVLEQKKDEKHRERMILFLKSAINQPKFSVSDYYDRTQQQQETLQAEKENQEPYVIILWCGNDGLRLNDDGSFEWISKSNKNEKSKQKLQLENIQSIKAILDADIQTQIENLRYEMLRQQMQAAQIQQNQNIINSLHSPQLWTVSQEYMMNRKRRNE